MRVLVIGNGGREHALVLALARSAVVEQVFCAPGNPGTALLAENLPLVAESAAGIQGLIEWALGAALDLTIVGPELPLSLGIVDEFRVAGLPILGPTQAAARLESSKVWARAFMDRYGIPGPAYHVTRSAEELGAYLAHAPFPLVLKADSLAAGKGTVVARTFAEAREGLLWMEQAGIVGEGEGRETIVCEEFVAGREVTALAFTDGKIVLPLPPVQVYKRLEDGDSGAMTAGMGGYSPVPGIDAEQWAEIAAGVLLPAIAGLAAEGCAYRGFLSATLSLTAAGPRVLGLNTRLGDPEAQLLLPRLDSDFGALLRALQGERLHEWTPALRWSADASVGVVLAAQGYPAQSVVGRPITGLGDLPEGVLAFQMATRLQAAGPHWVRPGATTPDAAELYDARVDEQPPLIASGIFRYLRVKPLPDRFSPRPEDDLATLLAGPRLVNTGGRVLTLVGRGPDLATARDRAYAGVARISWDGMRYRTDIGRRDAPAGRPAG